MENKFGKTKSMPVGLLYGLLMSLAVTVLGSGILAKLVETETVEESGIGYGVMIILILAAYAGTIISFHRIGRKRLPVCLFLGTLYLGVLLAVTALFFGARYHGIGVKALLIYCGSFLGVLPGFRENRGGKIRKIKIANC